ncbi:DUF2637 domain-containing protein [Streptomyces violaceus]|uniref:DUF2637 domain-containing protein n=1 Tax=Streptomyces violaceus TaxID=1936 RepID=A0ABY9UBF0_STRVL|nr:DUF2637 domain-containing protein [Streptomyces janthinus]WND19898.1 DUF2637 domain-containing protein [Streptomyces janthinus]GGS93430.1 hypothetical protein GCM10010270_76960 [Streptomyces janthinus]
MNRRGRILLVVALIGVVAMAFRVSWNALRDVAKAIGADATAALLYPFVVDGLMALALVATLVLTDKGDKRFALRVLAAYTLASLALNYVHGLVPALHDAPVGRVRLAQWDAAHWVLVLLASSLPVGSIYFGSDLVAKVLHQRTPAAVEAPVCGPDEGASAPAPHTPAHTEQPPTATDINTRPTAPLPESSALVTAHADAERTPDPHTPHTARTRQAETADEALRQSQFEEAELERMRQDARRAYTESVQAGRPLSARALGEAFGMSESWGRKQILAVRDEEEPSRPLLRAVDTAAV